jgi:hypothetical protein
MSQPYVLTFYRLCVTSPHCWQRPSCINKTHCNVILTYLDFGLPLAFALLEILSLVRFSEVECDSDAMDLVSTWLTL